MTTSHATGDDPGDRLRADAVRNRATLVAAARTVLRREGPDFPFTAVAGEAELGRATLYRHFPSRGELVAAIVDETVDELTADLATSMDAREALTTIARSMSENVELTQLLAAGLDAVGPSRDRVVEEVRGAISSPGRPVSTGTATLALLMIATVTVRTPPDARTTALDETVRMLVEGVAPPT